VTYRKDDPEFLCFLSNSIVREMKPSAETLVRDKTAVVIAQHNLPSVFFRRVYADILHLFMESELRTSTHRASLRATRIGTRRATFRAGGRVNSRKGI